MEIFNDHRKLFGMAFLLFAVLSVFIVILPALKNQRDNAPLPGIEKLGGDALAGKHVFIANGCVSCHSQQVRNVDMDKTWGARPGVAADYAGNARMSWWMNTATLMGTERTGPDLTNIGIRLPAADWHLLHLYNPRAVVEESVMPAYPWMFEWKEAPETADKIVNVPGRYLNGRTGTLVAKKEALQLVAYLLSLKQVPLPDGTQTPAFLYKQEEENPEAVQPVEDDGVRLYANNCQACHQTNGEGLPGAFPALKGSAIVLDDNPEILVEIIMRGYNAREEYGEMPAIGVSNKLGAPEITAIINHERSSWGNNARMVPVDEVEKIILYLEKENSIQ